MHGLLHFTPFYNDNERNRNVFCSTRQAKLTQKATNLSQVNLTAFVGQVQTDFPQFHELNSQSWMEFGIILPEIRLQLDRRTMVLIFEQEQGRFSKSRTIQARVIGGGELSSTTTTAG